ncbi:fibroblast growth factor-binding protein 2-like [Anabas testudineus]|uniref:fibroblast growth factor-binding protein 2-like n=1 Tax=Anabas testudineus TaxID=64144 RepID=UPI000E45E564|nr:fibroblast growth factor-binding protein 2-like [Anabas testudineus]
MWAQASALLMLLLACCLWPADAQSIRGQNIWDEPIKFKTKSNHSCTMTITHPRQYTRMRVECTSRKNLYWCDFVGKPQTCRPYNKNPQHYFVEILWGFRNLTHACRGQMRIKPHMCRNATNKSDMTFLSVSYYPLNRIIGTRGQPAKPQPAPAPTMHHSASKTSPKSIQLTTENTTTSTTPQSTTPPEESTAKRMAQQH